MKPCIVDVDVRLGVELSQHCKRIWGVNGVDNEDEVVQSVVCQTSDRKIPCSNSVRESEKPFLRIYLRQAVNLCLLRSANLLIPADYGFDTLVPASVRCCESLMNFWGYREYYGALS
jgi:hypothetical protein